MLDYFVTTCKRFLKEEDGPTAVEYAVMLALILVGCISAVLMTGDVQRSIFEDNASSMHDAMFGNGN